MAITHDQLVEGGPVYFTMFVKGSSGSGQRRMPAKVIDIHDDAATIQLLHSKSIRQVKFHHLEPDLDWLSKKYEELNKKQRKQLAREAQFAPRTPLFDKPPIPEPAAEAPQITLYEGHPSLQSATEPPPLAELVEQAREELRTEPAPPPADDAAADLAAYLELGKNLLKRLEAAPEEERQSLEEQRVAIERRMAVLKAEGESMPTKKGQRFKPPGEIAAVLEDLRNGMSQREVSRKHKVSSSSIYEWKKEAELKKAQEAKKAARKTAIPALPDTVRDAVIADAGSGLSTRQLAKKHGASPATISRWLTKAEKDKKAGKNAEKKPRKKAKEKTPAPGMGFYAYPEEKRQAALEDIRAGMSVMHAAEKHGVNKATIYNWMKGEGTGRPGGWHKAQMVEPLAKPKVSQAVKESGSPHQVAEENRRLRAALAKLIAQVPTDAAALAEDNRKLRMIIDLWLGLS